MIKLNCPSCGGALELPDSLSMAHCMYCGTRILLRQPDTAREQQHLERYTDLYKTAVEATNYEEAIQYCNRVLEIDPKNVEAWIAKAVSTRWLSTMDHDRYGEAMEYLRRAEQIAPHDSRITDARDDAARRHALWYGLRGAALFKQATEMRGIVPLGSTPLADETIGQVYIQAMDSFLKALSYTPDDPVTLEYIGLCAEQTPWIRWTEEVSVNLRKLHSLRARKQALEGLTKLDAQLEEAEANLARLRTQKGWFVGSKIKTAEANVQRIRAAIEQLEQAAAREGAKQSTT